MCSIKKLFLEISENSQKNMCQSLFFNKVAAFRPINSIIKQYYSCCIILIRIDNILSKNIQKKFQNLLFKKFPAKLGDQTDIFWKFYSPGDTLWLPKCQVTPLRKPDDYFCIFHPPFFIDFCHPTNRTQVFPILKHVLSQLLKVINMNFAFQKLHFLTAQLLLHGFTHFILGDIT